MSRKMSRQSQLIKSFVFPNNCLSVKVYLSYDILVAPLDYYDFLLNPANEALVGARFPYFPRGGPVPHLPKDGYVLSSSRWGGMDAGEDMLYPVQVLDGLVHEEGGPQLLKYLQTLPVQAPFRDAVGQPVRCPVGGSVTSPSFGSLTSFVGQIIHTVAPFGNDVDWESKLLGCYLSSFRLAWGPSSNTKSMASVLLGAGCRGISVQNAARVASIACFAYSQELLGGNKTTGITKNSKCERDASKVLHFILREEESCQILADHIADKC